MSSRLCLTLVLSSVVLMGCGGAPADVRAKVAVLQQRLSDGQLANIREEYRTAHKTPVMFEYDMGVRAKLGRPIRTTEADVMWARLGELVIVYHNTEFEGGEHAVETFSFQVGSAEPQLVGYWLQPGKRRWCPMITISAGSCSTEDVPATMTSSR